MASDAPVDAPVDASVDSGIVRADLRAKLHALGDDGRRERTEVLALLRATLDEALALATKKFEMGRLNGIEMARLIAAIHDDVFAELYNYTTTFVVRAANPTKAERIAICAVGGYGRAEMAPFSDLDLLFVLADKKGSPFTESVTEYILYMLWDLGLKVGHATRTVEQCTALAKEDQTILTALLDLRFLVGDEALAEDLFARFAKFISAGKGRNYIATKLDERDVRHERAGNSRYVIEPNIKEGKGGLRDLHVLYWIARYLEINKSPSKIIVGKIIAGKTISEPDINDPQQADNYVDLGLFGEKSAMRFSRAADFLWRARIHLHLCSGRATESLSFDRQTELARKMGYAGGRIEEAVAGFMREYFINAREVGALTRIACAKLEADNALRLPAGLDRFLPNARRGMKEDGFILDHGRLSFADPMQLRDDRSLIMRLFLIAGKRNLDIHPDAFGAINFRRNLIDSDFRRDPEISKIFQNILLTAKAPYATLKVMNEAGVLGRYLLEFGGIVARTQFNMHHAYTVDEHTLRLVNYFHDMLSGELIRENPVATEIVKGFTRSQKRILYMACLLHDTGKGKGDQCIEGAQLGRRACRRLGLAQDEVDTVAWLIRRHLDLSETAQRRDISDPDTIIGFATLIGSQTRLDLLYILTIVDIRAVGPGIWNDWKGVLLRDLHAATSRYLEGKEELAPAARAHAAREQLGERLPVSHGERIAEFISELGDRYWLNFTMAALVRHARFFDDMVESGKDTACQTRRDLPRDITELWVAARDRSSLFTDITKAIASSGATIVGAHLHTGPDAIGNDINDESARVMNVFYLQNTDGHAFGRKSDQALARLRERATQAVLGEVETLVIAKALSSRRADAIPVRAKVSFPKIGRDGVSLIEVVGRDRPGLLYDIASCLHELGLDLLSAHIEVVGERAVDAFYVKGDIVEASHRRKISKALRKVLGDPASKVSAPQNSAVKPTKRATQ